MKTKRIYLILFLFSAHLIFTPAFATAPPLRNVHVALYDYYAPQAKTKQNVQDKQQLWVYINQNPLLQEILDSFYSEILHSSPKDQINQKLIASSLQTAMQSKNAAHIKLAFEIRKLYLSMIYNDQFANAVAKIEQKNKTVIKHNTQMPASLLETKDNTITHKNGEFDYLIVGSGPAGSLIANQLRMLKPDSKILILDAGSFIAPNTVDTTLDSDFIEMHNLRTTTSGAIILRNGEAVGGGTTVNIDLAFSPLLPSTKQKLNLWIEEKHIPQEFIHKKNKDFAIVSDAYAWVVKALQTRDVHPSEVNTNNRILLNGISTAKTYALNQKDSKQHPFILKNSAVDMLLMPALQQSNGTGSLSLVPNVRVARINFANSLGKRRANSVTILPTAAVDKEYVIKDLNNLALKAGQEYEIRAKQIILAAGTLGSAAILLNSDLQNDQIGRGITIHPSMGVVGEFDQVIDAHEGLSASVYATSHNLNDGFYFESMGDTPSFVALIHPGSGAEIMSSIQNFRHLGGFGVMLIDNPSVNNKVFIDREHQVLSVDYTLSEDDKDRFKFALIQAVEILFDQGAKKVFVPSLELSLYAKSPVFTDKQQAVQAISQMQFTENLNFITSAHMQGSNKMGADPKKSVVSHNFKVWDGATGEEIPNLYVVDSSIFPTSVGANPMQSIYTFAKIFVDKLTMDQL